MNSSTEFPLISYMRILRQRKTLFLVLLVVLAVVAFASSDIRQRGLEKPTVFKSQMTLLISPPVNKRNDDEANTELESWFASEELLKQLITSEDVLSQTVAKTGYDKDWRHLRGNIRFMDVGDGGKLGREGSFLLGIEVTAETAEVSQQLGRVLADEVIQYTQDLAAREKVASRKTLEILALERKTRIEQAQKDILSWRKQNDVWNLGQLTQAQSDRIQSLEEEKRGFLKQVGILDAELSLLEKRRATGLAPAGSSAEEQRTLRELLSRKTALEGKLAEYSKIYTPESGRIRDLKSELSELESSCEAERVVLYRAARSGVATKRSKLLAEVAKLDAALRGEKQNNGLAKAQVELQKLEYELAVSRKRYQETLAKIDETKVEEQAKRNEANFTLVERPSPGMMHGGSTPSTLKKEKIASLLVFSLIVSLFVTIGYGSLAETYSLRKQVEILGLPVLGVIPKTSKDFDHNAFIDHPSSTLAGQVRRLVVNLMRTDTELKKILVTSCWPSEGKSFISANLAAALTKFNLKVALVDADLRKPFLTQFFEKQKEMGLRQALKDSYPMVELTQPTDTENLSFLPAGSGRDDPAELLHRKLELDTLLPREGGFLVVDSAPLSVCSDATQISDHVDGVILVVSAKHWTGKAELEYVLDLEEQGVKVLGVVLNGVKASELTYYQNYKHVYGKYYGSVPSETRV